VQQQPIQTWNTVRSAWEKPLTENLLCEHLEVFSETWQTSGMMRNGQVFELPMQERHTTAIEFLSSPILRSPKASEGQGEKVTRQMLPTPNTMEHREVKSPEQIEELRAKSPGGYRNLREEVINNLPTPTTRDYKDGSAEHERDGKVQTDTVARAVFNSGEILPTTTASDWKGANHSGSGSASSRGISTVVEQTNWGKFEPAIKRWEATIGRQAPEPTKPDGKDGAHRLSSKFTEWMMGLPDGWITDVGLSRNDELKACGNGVVPQQAELALRILMSND